MHHPPQSYRPPQAKTPKQRSDRNARIIAGLFGASMILFSLPCVATGLYEMAAGSADAGTLGAVVLFGGFSLIGMILGIWAVRKRSLPPATLDASSEHMVLSLAKSNRGVLTVPELSLQAHLSLEQSEQLLEDMTKRNVAEVDIAADGNIVYIFPAFARGAHTTQQSHQDRADLDAFSHKLADAQQETQFDFQSGASPRDGSVGRPQNASRHAQNAAHGSTYKK